MSRLDYWRRIAAAYFLPGGNLSFWHERPAVEPKAQYDRLGPYYMTFADKAGYKGPFDAEGVPQLDYRGNIGRKYNPIAVAQYGLAHYNLFKLDQRAGSWDIFRRQADWLVKNLEPNDRGFDVWMHHFDFEYRQTLCSPWYSGLAQGQGLSLLARAWVETKDERYRNAMQRAFRSMLVQVADGGVLWHDPDGSVWIEEYILNPPTHILNGFIWALWGVRYYCLAEGGGEAEELFTACVKSLARVLSRYDNGRWSLYELSDTLLPMLASPFYHRLHIVQLRILQGMTGVAVFGQIAQRWEVYAQRHWNRSVSLAQKCAFKVLYY